MNTNKLIAGLLNFVIGVAILIGGMYLLEVPTAENIFQLAQHIVGLILVYFGMDFDLFKGE